MKIVDNVMAFEWLDSTFSILTQEEINSLFYFSLFDPSGWEEDDLTFHFNEEELRKEIKDFLKKYKFNESGDRNIDRYILSNFYNGKIINQLICLHLKKLGLKAKTESKSTENIDLLIIKNGKPIYIELKRLLSTSNLEEQLNNYIQKIKKKSLNKNKHFFIILIPILEDDNYLRYQKILWGYRHLIEYKFKNECETKLNAFAIPAKKYCLNNNESAITSVGDIIKGT